MPPSPELVDTEVCILGAGPHGLAAAVHLRRARSDLEMVVVDPAGTWLEGWHEQFARAEIATLRSPIVHHPAPDPYELTDCIAERGLARSGMPYDLPTTEVFATFCRGLVESEHLAPPLAAAAKSVTRDGPGVCVATDGPTVRAQRLVVATNPHLRSIPDWVWPLLGARPGQIAYGADVDLRGIDDLRGERVTIVGGGLSAAHLVCGAAARGAEVHLVARRPLETRNFDTDPGWLGPKYLRKFDTDADPVRRLRTVLEARGGGTIPPWMATRLDALVDDGRLTVHEDCRVRAAGIESDASVVLALDDHTTLRTDRIWLGTGTRPHLGALRCLRDLVADIPSLHGVPITAPDLTLGPHPIHVMGRLAALSLGPAAGNLWGAQRAAHRIAQSITGIDLEEQRAAAASDDAVHPTVAGGRR